MKTKIKNPDSIVHKLCFLLIIVFVWPDIPARSQEIRKAPAPVFRDPITDGAADPILVYNPFEKSWWMLYTQRRANAETAGQAYCYGNDIGIAASNDNGRSWRYRGTLDLAVERGKNTFWAPEVVLHNGVYHMFVTYIQGVDNHWSGRARISHYTSANLWDWKHEGFVALPSEDAIDATLYRLPNGDWRMWYKANNISMYSDSRDLFTWKNYPEAAIKDKAHEGPKVFKFKGSYWMITDQWAGMGVYRSDDLDNWIKQPAPILDHGSSRPDDRPSGAHGDVVVAGDRAYIFYFTHPGRGKHIDEFVGENGNIPYELRRSSIQAAALDVVDGQLVVADRDKPFDFYLPDL
jgi:hypothetical protein